jgi:hypothetical protein
MEKEEAIRAALINRHIERLLAVYTESDLRNYFYDRVYTELEQLPLHELVAKELVND